MKIKNKKMLSLKQLTYLIYITSSSSSSRGGKSNNSSSQSEVQMQPAAAMITNGVIPPNKKESFTDVFSIKGYLLLLLLLNKIQFTLDKSNLSFLD